MRRLDRRVVAGQDRTVDARQVQARRWGVLARRVRRHDPPRLFDTDGGNQLGTREFVLEVARHDDARHPAEAVLRLPLLRPDAEELEFDG
jgi:hypothetical protein